MAAFSCSNADSVLVRLVGELAVAVLTFSAEPVLRRASTGRAGATVLPFEVGGKLREVASDVVVLRSFNVGVGDPSPA